MPVPQLVGRLVCQSIAQMSKPRKTTDPGVNLSSCHLPTFVHFHSPSFTLIHFQAIIKNVHSSKTFIHTFLISQVHISAFFSQLKTRKDEIPVSYFYTHKVKDEKKLEFNENKPKRATVACVWK